jgi:hypothetical protein
MRDENPNKKVRVFQVDSYVVHNDVSVSVPDLVLVAFGVQKAVLVQDPCQEVVQHQSKGQGLPL